MEITVQLDDALVAAAREFADRTRRSLDSIVVEALRQSVGYQPAWSGDRTPSFTTFGGKGPRPGVDLDNSEALRDLMDGFDGSP